MFERFRKTVVESYVGAIALGWVFAQALLHFAGIFTAPFVSCYAREQYSRISGATTAPSALSFKDSLPDFLNFIALTIVGCAILWWLYYAPKEDLAATEERAQTEESA